MCYENLPDSYVYLDKINLKNNRKQFWIVQGIALVITIVMLCIGWIIVSLNEVIELLKNNLTEGNYLDFFIPPIVLIVGFIIYIVAHEATHAVAMRASLKAKVKFGFVGWAAYAGSNAFYDKKHYVIIALAPVIVWGIVFGVLNAVFHSGIWFWVIWLLQLGNISGASGDLFCTYKMITYPKDILVQDTGLEMTVYSILVPEINDVSEGEDGGKID